MLGIHERSPDRIGIAAKTVHGGLIESLGWSNSGEPGTHGAIKRMFNYDSRLGYTSEDEPRILSRSQTNRSIRRGILWRAECAGIVCTIMQFVICPEAGNYGSHSQANLLEGILLGDFNLLHC